MGDRCVTGDEKRGGGPLLPLPPQARREREAGGTLAAKFRETGGFHSRGGGRPVRASGQRLAYTRCIPHGTAVGARTCPVSEVR